MSTVYYTWVILFHHQDPQRNCNPRFALHKQQQKLVNFILTRDTNGQDCTISISSGNCSTIRTGLPNQHIKCTCHVVSKAQSGHTSLGWQSAEQEGRADCAASQKQDALVSFAASSEIQED